MAVGVTAEASAQSSATTVATPSINVSASVTNLVAYCQISDGSNNGSSGGTTWDVASPESFTEESDGEWFSNDARNLFAYLHNPTAATDTVTHTNSGPAPDEHIIIVWSVTGGDSSVRTAPTAETASAASVLTMTNGNTQSGDAVFYGFGLIDGGGGSPAANSYDQGTSQGQDETFTYVLGAGCFEAATSTSETGGITSSQSGDTREISLAIPAAAEGGGPDTAKNLLLLGVG